MDQPKRKPAILITLNTLVIVIFLLICLTPFLASSGVGWFVSMLGMSFPYVGLLVCIFLIGWLFSLHTRWAKTMFLVNLVVLLLGYQQIRAVFAFHFFAPDPAATSQEGIRVMSWNVSGWDIHNWDAKNHNTYQPLMYDLIEQLGPDVLLLQEFFDCTDPSIVPSYLDLLTKRGYPYYYYTPQSITVSGKFRSGLAMFSRYPLQDTAFFLPETAGHADGFQQADITIDGRTIRFFNARLESPGMESYELGSSEADGSRTLFYKLKYSHQMRMGQVRMLKHKMNESPYPVIFGGDMNNLPNTTIYFYLKQGLKDAFIKKGSGIGRTFQYVAPTLRIDYIFADPRFTIHSFSVIDKPYSDHYPIISDISE